MNSNLDKQEAANQARDFIARAPLYLDTETTGLGPGSEIIEIGIIDDNGAVLFESFVRPRGEIGRDAERIHGISTGMVANAPAWSEVWPSVENLIKDRWVGIYNREFDLQLMKQSHQRNWMLWRMHEQYFFCIMKLYARFRGEWDSRKGDFRWHSLEAAGRHSGIPLHIAHRAADDARLARALLHYMAQ